MRNYIEGLQKMVLNHEIPNIRLFIVYMLVMRGLRLVNSYSNPATRYTFNQFEGKNWKVEIHIIDDIVFLFDVRKEA